MIEGPKFGYFPEPEKSYVVIHPNFMHEAQTVFDGTGIQIVTGRKFLGGFIGGKDDTVNWMEKKIESWVRAVHKLSNAAKSQPQAAFVAFTKSLQAEWAYFQRVMEKSSLFFSPLKEVIVGSFLPDLFGSPISEIESEIFCRPSRHGGMGIFDPVKTAHSQFAKSNEATLHLIEALTNGIPLDLQKHDDQVRNSTLRQEVEENKMRDETLTLIRCLDDKSQRCILRKLNFKCSGWLSVD